MVHSCEASSLTIPARLSSTGIAAAYVEAAAALIGFDPNRSRQLAQSLLIILQDLISHAFSPDDNQDILISCQHLAVGFKITIAEKGLPLSPADLLSLRPESPACPLIPLEDRLACVREVWDEAEFRNLGRAGAEVALVKYFGGERASPQPACPQVFQVASAGPPAPHPETFTIRPFSPPDAQEVIRLLYRSYGYSYPYENLYYPDRLIALNAGGSLLSLVAVSSRAELVGHLAIFFSSNNPDLAEIGAAVVHPDFRGHGCLRQLSEYALAEAGRRDLAALYGRPVTNHLYSQKVSAELGFKPCGLLVGLGPASLTFKKIHEDLPQRESMLIIYRRLRPSPPPTIYPPPRHRDMILQLYDALGLGCEAAATGGSEPLSAKPPGHLDLSTFPGGGIALIKVKALGPDSWQQLRHHLKELCLARFEIIQLYLDLCQPCLPAVLPQFESLGFFFAGVLPGLNHTQTLILQYLNNVPLDYGKIQLYSPQAQDLLKYVKSLDPNLV